MAETGDSYRDINVCLQNVNNQRCTSFTCGCLFVCLCACMCVNVCVRACVRACARV